MVSALHIKPCLPKIHVKGQNVSIRHADKLFVIVSDLNGGWPAEIINYDSIFALHVRVAWSTGYEAGRKPSLPHPLR